MVEELLEWNEEFGVTNEEFDDILNKSMIEANQLYRALEQYGLKEISNKNMYNLSDSDQDDILCILNYLTNLFAIKNSYLLGKNDFAGEQTRILELEIKDNDPFPDSTIFF